MDGVSMRDMIPGCYDPVERIKDMNLDGVWASLCFPTYCRFAGARFLDYKDKDLALMCVQAYNDFVVDEWCATAPDRLIPLAILPLWDAKLAAKEVERVAAKGARSVGFPEAVQPLGLPSWHTGYWDPVFAAAAETGLPLSSHIGTSQVQPKVSTDALGMRKGVSPATNSLVCMSSMIMVADVIFSHIPYKFPDLKIALSEGGVGWIPYLKERMDYTWERATWSEVAEVRPSELFDRHFWGCYIDDEVGTRERHAIGIDNLTIEVDYPHLDTTWPHTKKRVSELLSDVSDEEAHKIVELNARDLFNFQQ
jgi:predicted TIM-barrel fold metal-dependent hydrolase